ncbi:MAG TPA: DUF885 domain-containing protein [Lacipirellulaceae bacterium]|nr:DUF885 domain-containing protein [Lacipirellulaceae bacterium]
MTHPRRTAPTLLLLFLGATGYASAAASTDAHPAWAIYVQQFLADYFTAHPGFAVYSGKHEFDGQIADFSESALQKETKRLHAARIKTAAFNNDQLSDRERFERDYLLAQIDSDLFWLEVADQPHTAPFWYADALDPDVYVTREYAPLETRIKSYTEFAGNVPRALQQIKTNLKLPLAKTAIKIGHRTIGGLADFFAKDVPAVFAPVKDKQAQADFKTANDTAIKAIRDFDGWLTAQEATANGEFALGPEKFGKMLKMTEQVDIPLGRLEAIGQRDLDRNLAALNAACAQYAPGKTLAECIVQADTHKTDDTDPVVAARKQLTELRKFIIDNNVVTVPGTEEAEVRQAPAYKAWNFAFITIPGPYEKGLPSIYYISPPDPTWPKPKQDAYTPGRAGLLFTSAHEVYPGHFVQFLHAHRAHSEIGQLFVGYAFSEGWAHYCEEMVYEEGLGNNDPETHIAQLHEALLRNVRFLSAIGLHTQGMTVEESKRLFIEKAFQDEGNAEQQALRGTFDPAYLNYTLGKLMIRKLRDDWCATRGGKKAWKDFHDEFLKFGGPPIPLIRRAMLGPNDNGSLF